MRGKRWLTVVAVACLLALAGCGSSSSKSSSSATSSPSASSASASSTSTSSSTAASGTEASKPPEQILSDAAAALRGAKGYVMQGSITQGGKVVNVKLSTTSPKAIDIVLGLGPATANLIGLSNSSYIRANTTFWKSQAGPSAAKLAGRWIEVPTQDAHSVTASLGELAPANLSRCLLENHGTLSAGGNTTVNGQPAVLVNDAGDKPGSTKSMLAVASSGTPYPLRYTATGAQRAGGHVDVCSTGKASNARGSISFSDFGKVPPIHPPAGAVKIP
ncbi:MAG: hypothetical protein WAK93_11170 [Solirubrobacteraceae bacterium]